MQASLNLSRASLLSYRYCTFHLSQVYFWEFLNIYTNSSVLEVLREALRACQFRVRYLREGNVNS